MISLTRLKAVLHVIAVIAMLAVNAPAAAQGVAPYKVAGGLAVYLGVLPAEMITGHTEGHTEAEMHGGVPSGRHVHHVMVAIFDEASGQRITDAVVGALVAGIGLAGIEKTLDPMTIADAVTYGNYFNLPGRDRYRIRIEITRPGATRPVRVEFEYDHQS
ncbi:MAG: hypothetical protein L0219_08435 [Phycisphaerales bacterium]|nr:hypothetical protein [Phycisphaerales bacterium]